MLNCIGAVSYYFYLIMWLTSSTLAFLYHFSKEQGKNGLYQIHMLLHRLAPERRDVCKQSSSGRKDLSNEYRRSKRHEYQPR